MRNANTMRPLLKGQEQNYASSYEASNNCSCLVKCVLIGDGAIGKTSLIIGYTTNAYPKEYKPTAYDKYSVIVTVNSKPIRLQICDTAGQDDFDALRPLCYPGTDVFLLCFSIVYPASFYNIAEKWIYEVKHHSPKTPILLVGTQCDLRTDVGVLLELAEYGEQPITSQQAKALGSQIGAVSYIECSSLTKKNLKEVFDTALLAALKARTNEINFLSEPESKLKHKYNKEHNYGSYTRKSRKHGWKKYWCFS